MHSEIATEPSETDQHTVDADAYVPYKEAFPPLTEGGKTPEAAAVAPRVVDGTGDKWTSSSAASKPVRRSNSVTQVFSMPVEERRFKELTASSFGKVDQTNKICQDIMTKTGVSIEMSQAKDQSLTVVLTGRLDCVMKARKMVVQQLQQQAMVQLSIPKEHHKYILGQQGKRLIELELNTATKISIPRPDDPSDLIKILGNKEGIQRARDEIQNLSDEWAKRAVERLNVPKEYHPFVCGPNNKYVDDLVQRTGVRISVPPPLVEKNEIVVSGEKEGVQVAVRQIRRIYEEKRRRCQTVSVEVRKSQHKYVVGTKGSNLHEILELCGVSVEVPPFENSSETITLRGEQDQLGQALTMVYAKANSVVITEVAADAWLHRYIIGPKGKNIKKITDELPKVHIEFEDGKDKITVEGPPGDVEKAKQQLESLTRELKQRMAFDEIKVDPKYHRHIIGKSGANVIRIKNETGVSIKIPSDQDKSSIIRIEGSPEGVKKAQQELREMVAKMENEKSRDIIIEQRFHKAIIGARGEKIREIRDKFNQLQVTFPDSGKKSDIVTLRGPKDDVDKCYKYLQQLVVELQQSNFQSSVHIFKQFHKNIIGKHGANIRKIRDETETRIEIPAENSDSDAIVITGKKQNVQKATAMIEAIQKELANIREISIDIPHKYHNSIIGAKGHLIRSIMEECGGVVVRFPSEGSTSDKVVVRGPKDDVEKAKQQLLELANDRKESSYTEEVHAKPEYHKFMIGRGGVNIRKVRDKTGARVIFPTARDEESDVITIIGKKDSVQKARTEIEALIKNLDNIVDAEITVDPKYHRHFVARRGEVLRSIEADFGGTTVSFPRSGVKSDKVTLKGAKDCVEGAKARILEIVADLEAQVTMECVIPQDYHRTIMGSKGHQVQEISSDYNVTIKFPDRSPPGKASTQNGEQNGGERRPNGEEINGDRESSESNSESEKPKRADVILVTGLKEKCEGAIGALKALVPITKEVEVDASLHRFIIGKKGGDVRALMEEYNVSITIPPADSQQDIIKITGPPANVKRAEAALQEKIKALLAEQEDRRLKEFQVEVNINPKYHPKIIGRKGSNINKLRTQHSVRIQFPDRNSDRDDVITITGYEANANAAKEEMLAIAKELEDQVEEVVDIDARIHPRLIGQRGRNIRKIMDDFKVDIRFAKPESDNPDAVTITGDEDDVFDCKDHLLLIAEEFMQTIRENEMLQQHVLPSRDAPKPAANAGGGSSKGFIVVDAPWSEAPDTSSTSDFPHFASSKKGPRNTPTWGPVRKK